jgi:predicted Zn finger-like uncharacterized protein
MIVSCDCGAKLKIDETKITGKHVKIRCPRCGNVIPLEQPALAAHAPVVKKTQLHPLPSSILVLVAHDSVVVRDMVSGVLTAAGFRVELVSNGVDALKKATELRPQGLVLDVGLPGIYGFELCERLKDNPATKDIKIILLSSVYDRRRYKRTPASLYGADDYIEKHHIPDLLTVKLRNLISPQEPVKKIASKLVAPMRQELPEMSRPPAREFDSSLLRHNSVPHVARVFQDPAQQSPPTSPVAHADSSERAAVMPESLSLDASIFQKEEFDVPGVDEGDPEAIEKARRFARIIVSDIALYNQEAVIEGIKAGTFFALLKNDVDEGRELFEKRIPAATRAKKDYYQEAFDNFIDAAKRKNVR